MSQLCGHSITYRIAVGPQAGVAARADEGKKLERLCRYISRPAVSEKRLSLTPMSAPDDPGVQDTCGWLRVQQGQIESGRHLLGKALQQLPNKPDVRYHYTVALYHSGDHDQALGMLEDLLAEAGDFTGRPDAQQFLAENQP